MSRLPDLIRFYELLQSLEQRLGGFRHLAQCSGRQGWPARGVYFFFEPGEIRSDSGQGPRVTRVGTHALKQASSSTLWGRLSQHRGQVRDGAGNHRGSIFRLLVGEALMYRNNKVSHLPTWGLGSDAGAAAERLGWTREQVKAAERSWEIQVSDYIGNMPFLWLTIDDLPGPDSLRGYIERNAIGILSNFNQEFVDPPSNTWLGRDSGRERVRQSGLWNNNHVDEGYDASFLEQLERLVKLASA